jgi:hypothetical protein
MGRMGRIYVLLRKKSCQKIKNYFTTHFSIKLFLFLNYLINIFLIDIESVDVC